MPASLQQSKIAKMLEARDSPFRPPYRNDMCREHPVVQFQLPTKVVDVRNMHQEALMQLVHKCQWCPEPLPRLLTPDCPPSDTDLLQSERIHAILQLFSQIREQEQQSLMKKVYKTFGADHRKAAKELYAREHFSTAYTHYWSLFTCLACDTCRRMSPTTRHNITIDLLEKLAVTCLRAGWLTDAENFAREALLHEKRSTRARMWLATAQLGLAKLSLARTTLALLPVRGDFPPTFPPWIESRTQAQRAVLARLEAEAQGVFDIQALERDARDCTPGTPHSVALYGVEATPFGYRVCGGVEKGALLLVAPPLVCVPCYTPEHATPPRTLHDEDPSLLSLVQIADAVYTKSKALLHIRQAVLGAAARGGAACECVIDLVGNELRAAAIIAAQKYTLAIPHVVEEEPQSPSTSPSPSVSTTCERAVHAGHALYIPALSLGAAAAGAGNTYATFHGPYLFLRAARDLIAGTLLTFAEFPTSGDSFSDRSPNSTLAPDLPATPKSLSQ